MNKAEKITDAEWVIMEAIWKLGNPSTALISEYIAEHKWSRSTIKTLLSRLVDKEILSVIEDGRVFLYKAEISREECIHLKSKSFLKKFHNGHLKDLIAGFVRQEDMSPSEINELKKILETSE